MQKISYLFIKVNTHNEFFIKKFSLFSIFIRFYIEKGSPINRLPLFHAFGAKSANAYRID